MGASGAGLPMAKGAAQSPSVSSNEKKPSVRLKPSKETKGPATLRTYLLPLAASLFQVGCHVESFIRCHCLREHKAMSHMREPMMAFAAASNARMCTHSIQFDSDSYPIGVDCHASRCMANSPHLFEDLKLVKMGAVEDIKQGLDIKGVGTFKLKIDDNNGRMHEIKIPNSLYIPELRRCLLSPQFWAQEAGDNHPQPRGTCMENDDVNCVLFWGQGRFQKSNHVR